MCIRDSCTVEPDPIRSLRFAAKGRLRVEVGKVLNSVLHSADRICTEEMASWGWNLSGLVAKVGTEPRSVDDIGG